MRQVVDVETGVITEEDDAPITQTPAQLMAAEIAALTSAYKANVTSLQLTWLNVAVADGTTEDSKKAAVLADLATLKAQYFSDVVAVKTKYA